MKKILVMPNSNNLNMVLDSNVDGIILSLENFSVHSDIYFSLDDIKSIINKTNKEICVCINKIIHESELDKLESILILLNELNISKIFFYDLAVLRLCKKLNISKSLVVYQEHLNANSYTNKFYKNRGVDYSLITNDITKEEINEIAKNQKLMMVCYGYLPIFYSRRYLVSNYFEYIKKSKFSDIYYIKNNDDYYPVYEEENGSCIYTKAPINLINYVDDMDISYIVLNSFLISDDEFRKVLDDYINNKKSANDNYLGFLNEKTMYKVKENE